MKTTNVTFQDIQVSDSLDLSDMGKEMGIVSGCVELVKPPYNVHYVSDDFILSVDSSPLWFHDRGLMQTATGYGTKLKSDKVVKCGDNRVRRIYYDCHSNCASHYLIVGGERKYLRDSQL